MADALDAPTIYRQGAPVLGVPVLSLDYRNQVDRNTPLAAVLTILADQQLQLALLTKAVAYFDLPWYTKLWRSLCGRSRAAERRRAIRSALARATL